MVNRRTFLASTGAALAAAPAWGARDTAVAPGAAPAENSARLFLPLDDLKPATYDRLPLEWSRQRAKRLQAILAEEGFDGILLTDRWNVIYFTGLWHTTTERLFYAFFPASGSDPIWFYPSLDRDLVKSWWFTDGEVYFDWHHAKGAFPDEGKVHMGAKVDLFEWVLQGLRKRGFTGKKLAADRELTPSAQRKVVSVLGQEMESAAEHCLGMRMRKTAEELALWRRAYEYFNRAHAFARDLLLDRGTDLTDFEIANSATKYATDQVMADIRRDGGPHTAVGISINVNCRTGRATAYPHPNQFHHNKVQKGDCLQIAGALRIGGCGGELYRPFLIHPLTDHMKKLWTVNRDCCLMQKEESIAGVTCSTVAYKIHKYQVKNGVAPYIYHRPAHGEGSEGHQPPWLALGDHTMLEPGMCFSVEPGLFDSKRGVGTNFSDAFAIQPEGPARQMSRLPWSEEWCWVKL